jgi:predicted small lipoprotein YifL
MPQVQKHWSYSFTIGLALFLVCLIYIPQWRHYAPNAHQAAPTMPYLTPWTVVSVITLGLALALIAAPVRTHYPIQTILAKTLSTVVFCFGAVFLLEYASGIRVPDLDIFFLPDASGQRFSLYSARPTPHSATTSLLFASSLLVFHRETSWRKKAFRICVLAALVLPTLAAIGYVGEFFFPPAQPPDSKVGLSLPAVILYFILGSGILGLPLGSNASKSVVAQVHKTFRRPV